MLDKGSMTERERDSERRGGRERNRGTERVREGEFGLYPSSPLDERVGRQSEETRAVIELAS